MSDAVFDLHSRQLRAALAVAEYRSFVAAAAALKVSQPALTRTIKQLEARLGLLLFARSTREVAVTDAGKEFAALAERLINDLKIGVESVRERSSERRGQIFVASVISLASLVSPRLIAGFARRYGGVEIHFREGLQGGVRDDVRSGVADFGVGYLDRLPRLFATERLGAERFHAVLPAGHKLAAQREIRLKALEDVPLVSLPAESRTRRLIDAAAAAAGITLNHAATANRLPTLYSLVGNGVGLAVLAQSECSRGKDAAVVSRPLVDPCITADIGIIRLRERDLSAAAASLLAVIRTGLKEAASPRGKPRARRRKRSLVAAAVRRRNSAMQR